MIKVTVWNEYLEELQYEHVAKVYPNGIHECIREFLEKDPEIQVRCVTLRMEDQGLSDEILNDTDVLIWWGHQAHDEVTEENVQRVKQHVLDGMGLIALHSAHYSNPMKELLGTSMCVRWKHGEREKLVCVAPSHPIAEGIIEPVILEKEEMYGEYFDLEYLEKNRKDESLSAIPESKGVYTVETNGEKIDIPYELKGWMGIHASIDPTEAQKNDKNFIKNRYYNPNKLRLYIRNKLAVEDFMGYIKNTQQGANYIEGEISFDLLDDNRLEDITTSNRQDVDIHDPRVALLIAIVKKIVTRLIGSRNSITEEVSKENKRRKSLLESTAKKNAQNAIKNDLLSMGLGEKQSNDVIVAVGSKLKGTPNAEAKEIYKLFISHSKRDRRFSDFIYNLLRLKGAKEVDIFYTTHEVVANSRLSDDIKENIASINELVLFLDSVNSRRSQYCMFEGGAFWATRSIENCIHIHFDTSWIPDYINDSGKYHVPLNEGRNLTLQTFDITTKKYNEITQVLNVAIEHINCSATHTINKIPLFARVDFPTDIELKRAGKTLIDYMDKDFVECWNYYVVNGETDLDVDSKKRSKEKYINDYNEIVGRT